MALRGVKTIRNLDQATKYSPTKKQRQLAKDTLRIALDLDGVLADATGSWLRLFKQRFRVPLRRSQINEWDFWKRLGLKQKDFEDIFAEAWQRWQSIRETEGNLPEKVDRLRSLGELDIVTGRSRDTIKYAAKWLSNKRINFGKIVLVGTYAPKAHLDYDVFIDDSPRHANEAAECGKIGLLYNQPWNKNVGEKDNLIRIQNLQDASTILENKLAESGLKG